MPYDHSLHFTGHSEQVERYFIWYLEKHSIQIQNYMKGATDCCDIEQYLFTALNTSSQTKKRNRTKPAQPTRSIGQGEKHHQQQHPNQNTELARKQTVDNRWSALGVTLLLCFYLLMQTQTHMMSSAKRIIYLTI